MSQEELSKKLLTYSTQGWKFHVEQGELRKPVYNSHVGDVYQFTPLFVAVGLIDGTVLASVGFTKDMAMEALFGRIG